MDFTSTRSSDRYGFADIAMLALAGGGGLTVPVVWPTLPDALLAPSGDAGNAGDAGASTYTATGAAISSLFADGTPYAGLQPAMWQDYALMFPAEPAPLRTLDEGLHVLELFHGPTLSFKDYALQWVGRMIDALLVASAQSRTILTATSGDTGAAALAAVLGRRNMRCIVLHPAGRISEVQRRQMTTLQADNVHNIAIEGNFDDCQRIVKTLFEQQAFDGALLAMNSINFLRIIGQIVYYVDLARRFHGDRPVDVIVPTGNFGNVYSAWAAKQLGARLGQLAVASNGNDAVVQYFHANRLRLTDTQATLAPAMDVQIPSNLERYVYATTDAAETNRLYRTMQEGAVAHTAPLPSTIAEGWTAAAFSDDAIVEHMRRSASQYGYPIDPHTATAMGLAAARHPDHETVVISTAHRAKFPEACTRAYGQAVHLPATEALQDLDEQYVTLPASVDTVRDHLSSNFL
ncbi:MAG: threonine synthase [Alphaproteobacteria bacterium]|nr:threonine synthase [Alphaproteobacteria bacterium]